MKTVNYDLCLLTRFRLIEIKYADEFLIATSHKQGAIWWKVYTFYNVAVLKWMDFFPCHSIPNL